MKRVLSFSHALWLVAAGILVAGSWSCSPPVFGKYPEPLSSKRDIRRVPAETDSILIRKLPLEDYPLLSKLTLVRQIRLDNMRGDEGGTDEKLKALAKLPLTNLLCVSLLNCSAVTDEGIRAVVKTPVKQLQLEGTSITDVACELMASRAQFSGERSGVNVANCPGVTLKGVKALAQSGVNSLTFSADKLTEDQVLEIIESFKNVSSCLIVDPQRKLDMTAIKKKGAEKNAQIVIHATGALQNMGLAP